MFHLNPPRVSSMTVSPFNVLGLSPFRRVRQVRVKPADSLLFLFASLSNRAMTQYPLGMPIRGLRNMYLFSKQRHGGLFFRIFVELGGLAGKHFRMKLDWDEVVIIVKREDWERLPARFKEALYTYSTRKAWRTTRVICHIVSDSRIEELPGFVSIRLSVRFQMEASTFRPHSDVLESFEISDKGALFVLGSARFGRKLCFAACATRRGIFGTAGPPEFSPPS